MNTKQIEAAAIFECEVQARLMTDALMRLRDDMRFIWTSADNIAVAVDEHKSPDYEAIASVAHSCSLLAKHLRDMADEIDRDLVMPYNEIMVAAAEQKRADS